MSRKYTGWDRNSNGKRAGLEKLVQLISAETGKNLWNNGTWLVRNKRGKNSWSVHGTGRACDISWRNMGERKGSGRYADAQKMMDFLVANADLLDIEAVFDYYPEPYGRGWKCDRNEWRVYDRRAFSGSPGGDWFHVEIGNRLADDSTAMAEAWEQAKSGGSAPKPAKKPATKPAPEPVAKEEPSVPFVRKVKRGSRGEQVKIVQQRLADLGYKNSTGKKPIVVDGLAGKTTEQRIKDFQSDHPCPPVDGIVGRLTWTALFGD